MFKATKTYLMKRKYPLVWDDIKIGQFAIAHRLPKYGKDTKDLIRNDGIGMQVWDGPYPPYGYFVGYHKYRFELSHHNGAIQ